MAISWTADGTQLAAAGGTGALCFGQLVDISAEDNHIYANVEDVNKVVVNDIIAETKDELDFRDRVIWMSLGNRLLARHHSHLPVHALCLGAALDTECSSDC
jgi:hypothetical protein